MSATITARQGRDRGGLTVNEFRAVVVDCCCGPVAIVFLLVMVALTLYGRESAFDFRHAYWVAGQRVMDGVSPYSWTQQQYVSDFAFVYPAASALLFAPLSLISVGVGSVLTTFACIGLLGVTLWMLGVRDWRVFGVVLLWLPVYRAWTTGNETIFLVFGTACVWRLRDRAWAAGVLVAAMISLKLLMWPLAIWLLATRRWRAAGYAVLSGLLINLVAWSVIGFGQISAFIHASGVDVTDSWRSGFGVVALAGRLGFSRGAGELLLVLLSAALIVALVVTGLNRRRDLPAMVLAIALALVSSPVMWDHYLTLLVIPLAIVYPRMNRLWAAPIVIWISAPVFTEHTWEIVLVWTVSATLLIATARRDVASASIQSPSALGTVIA